MPKSSNISIERWDEAADHFELGLKPASLIARELGVSPQTVMRQMKQRGAIKGRRSHETVADLEAFLERKARRRAHERAMAETTVAARRAAGLDILDRMLKAIQDADARGDLSLAAAEIGRATAAFGPNLGRRSGRR